MHLIKNLPPFIAISLISTQNNFNLWQKNSQFMKKSWNIFSEIQQENISFQTSFHSFDMKPEQESVIYVENDFYSNQVNKQEKNEIHLLYIVSLLSEWNSKFLNKNKYSINNIHIMKYAKFISILCIVAVSWSLYLSAEWRWWKKIIPKDYPIIIGCINEITWEIKSPLNQTNSACYHGSKGWKNLRFPSKKQFQQMKDVFKNKRWMVTAMTLINHESQFDSNAKGCSKNGCDWWIFQIRWVNWWKSMNDKQQMQWFANRKNWQLSANWNCYQRVLQGNNDAVLRCVFARHHWDLLWSARYPTARFREWKFYNSINF